MDDIVLGTIASVWFVATALFLFLLDQGKADFVLRMEEGSSTRAEMAFVAFVCLGILIAVGRIGYDCLAWMPYDWGTSDDGEWQPAREGAAATIALFVGFPLIAFMMHVPGKRLRIELLQSELAGMATIALAKSASELQNLIYKREGEVLLSTYRNAQSPDLSLIKAALENGKNPPFYLDRSIAAQRRRDVHNLIIQAAEARLNTITAT